MRTGISKLATIDAYLARLPADQRAALQKLRAQIRAAAPAAEEYIGYGLAGFKLDGHPLLYFGAATTIAPSMARSTQPVSPGSSRDSS